MAYKYYIRDLYLVEAAMIEKNRIGYTIWYRPQYNEDLKENVYGYIEYSKPLSTQELDRRGLFSTRFPNEIIR